MDVSKRQLQKRGVKIRLEHKPWQLLLALLERPGETVSRAEIENRLWPDGVFVDFEHGVNVAVNKLRQALLDSAASPRYIETVVGDGYRFIGTLLEIQPPATSDPVRAATVPPPSRQESEDVLIDASLDNRQSLSGLESESGSNVEEFVVVRRKPAFHKKAVFPVVGLVLALGLGFGAWR